MGRNEGWNSQEWVGREGGDEEGPEAGLLPAAGGFLPANPFLPPVDEQDPPHQ